VNPLEYTDKSYLVKTRILDKDINVLARMALIQYQQVTDK